MALGCLQRAAHGSLQRAAHGSLHTAAASEHLQSMGRTGAIVAKGVGYISSRRHLRTRVWSSMLSRMDRTRI